jgi:hypothetical protein
MSLDESDPTFVSDLKASHAAVLAVSEWFRGFGYPVIVRPTFIRENVERRSDYSDDGDLEIIQRIEVKHRKGLAFTSKEDFPFETVIVDTCHAWDNARPKPYAYIILNRSMSRALVVTGSTSKRWVKTRKFDTHAGRERSYYECPLELTQFRIIG